MVAIFHQLCGHLLEDEVKHEDEAAQVHVVIVTVQIQSTVASSVPQVFKGAATQRAAERAAEWTGERAQGVVLSTASWI